ncbi:MAG: gluconeogenesis factor YvcK family protein [Patescibacteria group bacterium]|nr:YvcK family protein [bacterium]MDZ4241081.1 gluconeogenesis factor YvcK family protein [Patescibacteria group bacterium]
MRFLSPTRKKKVVVIGGGTGSFVMLRGLKEYPFDITAVVTMFDSGGSSGILRDEFGVLPPGDARRCLVALSGGEREETLRSLFNFRFNNPGSTLHGHNFGNLFLTALAHIKSDDAEAIAEAGKLLNIKGTVLPVSVHKSQLCAELEDGSIIEGETNIDIPKHDGSKRIEKVFLKPEAHVYEKTREAITQADMIIIGPGDLYTSIIPNLLVKGVSEAIRESRAKKVYILNLMTKWGETHGFCASDFAREVLLYLGMKHFDVIVGNSKVVPSPLLKGYEAEKKYPVIIDGALSQYGGKIVIDDIYDDTSVLRHDSHKIAAIIGKL